MAMISTSESFRLLRLTGVIYFTFINPFSLQNMSKFEIDFFEFSFLVEACIPPVPIARSSFWDKVCNDYYHQLYPRERERLFEWIANNPKFKHSMEIGYEQCLAFYYRYNRDNQYRVITDDGVRFDCFKVGDEYYIVYTENLKQSILKEHIVSVEPLIQ